MTFLQFGGACDITGTNRKKCQSCRLSKCYEAVKILSSADYGVYFCFGSDYLSLTLFETFDQGMKAECVQKVRPSRRSESGKSKWEAAPKLPMTEGQVKRLEELVRSMEITRDLPADDVREFNSATEDNNKEPLLIHAVRSTYLDFLLVRNLAANVLRNHGVHLQDSDRLSMMTSYKRALLLRWAVENFNPVSGTLHLYGQDYNLDTFAMIGLNKEIVFRLFSSMAKLNLDKTETALLYATIIFTPQSGMSGELRMLLDCYQKEYWTLLMRKVTLARVVQAQRTLDLLTEVALKDKMFSALMVAHFPKLQEAFPYEAGEGGLKEVADNDPARPLPFLLPLGRHAGPHLPASCWPCSLLPEKLKLISH